MEICVRTGDFELLAFPIKTVMLSEVTRGNVWVVIFNSGNISVCWLTNFGLPSKFYYCLILHDLVEKMKQIWFLTIFLASKLQNLGSSTTFWYIHVMMMMERIFSQEYYKYCNSRNMKACLHLHWFKATEKLGRC